MHDFPSEALARAVTHGIYDVSKKRGSLYVGLSADTPEFAVTAIARCWWEEVGQKTYPQAKQLLILAGAGGSNGCHPRSFKLHLQEQVSDRYGLTVNVCHYPTGCSKWNPIEHRLFSSISLNWAGKPLRTLETMLNFLRGTTTKTGLTVRAALLVGTFETGQTVSEDQMKQLHIEHAVVCAQWNDTLRSRVAALSSSYIVEPATRKLFFNEPFIDCREKSRTSPLADEGERFLEQGASEWHHQECARPTCHLIYQLVTVKRTVKARFRLRASHLKPPVSWIAKKEGGEKFLTSSVNILWYACKSLI